MTTIWQRVSVEELGDRADWEEQLSLMILAGRLGCRGENQEWTMTSGVRVGRTMTGLFYRVFFIIFWLPGTQVHLEVQLHKVSLNLIMIALVLTFLNFTPDFQVSILFQQ